VHTDVQETKWHKCKENWHNINPAVVVLDNDKQQITIQFQELFTYLYYKTTLKNMAIFWDIASHIQYLPDNIVLIPDDSHLHTHQHENLKSQQHEKTMNLILPVNLITSITFIDLVWLIPSHTLILKTVPMVTGTYWQEEGCSELTENLSCTCVPGTKTKTKRTNIISSIRISCKKMLHFITQFYHIKQKQSSGISSISRISFGDWRPLKNASIRK
jgi:hypothetical protein